MTPHDHVSQVVRTVDALESSYLCRRVLGASEVAADLLRDPSERDLRHQQGA